MRKIIIEQVEYEVVETIILNNINYYLCYDESCDDYLFKQVDGIFQEIDSIEELAEIYKAFQDKIMG